MLAVAGEAYGHVVPCSGRTEQCCVLYGADTPNTTIEGLL